MRPRGSKNKSLDTNVYLYFPTTFNAANFPELYGLENEAHWLLNKIVSSCSRYKHDWGYTGLVNISRRTMRTFMTPADEAAIRNALIKNKVIIVDESYQISDLSRRVSGFSQSYGLHEQYAGDLRRAEVTKRKLAAKIEAHRLSLQNRPVGTNELDHTLAYLYGWLRKTKIDIAGAYQTIECQPDQPPKIMKVKIGKRGRRRFVRIAQPDAKALNRMVVDTIHQHAWEFAVCPYGRVHTNATRLLTECRPFLSIAGSTLHSVDIANSQLIFFLLLLLEARIRRYTNPPDSPSDISAGRSFLILPETGEPIPPEASRGSIPPEGSGTPLHPLRCNFYSWKEDSEDRPADKSTSRDYEAHLTGDEREFRDRVLDGTIYDVLMKKTGYTDRKKFKGAFFEGVLYGDNDAYYSRASPITRAFKEMFPSVWGFIVEQKSYKGSGRPQDAFKSLAREMQVRESRYMIGRVCGRLASFHAEIPAITIHDSILTTPDHLPTVVRIMREEFARVGVSPTLKVDVAGRQVKAA